MHKFLEKMKHPAVVIMCTVYIITVSLGTLGWIHLECALSRYSDKQMEFWAAGVLDKYISPADYNGDLLETPVFSDDGTPFDYVSYRICDENGALVEIRNDDSGYFDDRNALVFFKTVEQADGYVYDSRIVKTDKNKITCFFLKKDAYGHTYILQGYAPGKFFQYNRYFNTILRVYAAVITCLVIIIISSAGILVKHARLMSEQAREQGKRENAERVAKGRTEFLAHMSHEFRTPLNSIVGMNEMIKRQTSDPQIIEYTRYIEDAGISLLLMVNEILEFARMDAGKMQVTESSYHISDLAGHVEKLLEIQAKEKGLDFNIVIADNVPCALLGDYDKLRHIILNLGNNAVKYTNNGGISIKFDYAAGKLIVSVSDTGIGISAEDQYKIFDDYTRVNMNANQTVEGTGLGLSIVKRLVDAMGGEIVVKSIENEGTTFTVTVPQAVYIQSVDTTALLPDETFVAPGVRILVVDDTKTNIDVFLNLIGHTQMKADIALSGRQAIEQMKDNDYDIIFLDERMPEMSGLETFKLMREDGLSRDTRVVLLTANNSEDMREQAMELGIDRYMTKPVSGDTLENIIFQMLDSSKTTKVAKSSGIVSLPAWLLNNNEINAKAGLDYCGSPEAYYQALQSFADYASDKLAEIKSLLSSQDIEGFAIKVHAVKSGAKIIGAESLSEKAAKLEEAGNNRNEIYIKEYFPSFVQQYHYIAGMINKMLAPKETEKKDVEIEQGAIYGIMEHMQKYVQDFNDEAIGSMINAIGQYQLPGEVQSDFDIFCKAYKNVDWMQMEEMIDRMVDNSRTWRENN